MDYKRILDLAIAIPALIASLPVQLCVAIAVKATSAGPAVYWSDRVGQHNEIFKMGKYRTMRVDTPDVATHLLEDPSNWLTPIGSFLRRSSLDELPQLWHVIRGDMSLVGPRPALFNQDDLVALRTSFGIDALRPGVTGLAQVEGRDDLSIPDKVELDRQYLESQGLRTDLKLLVRTASAVLAQRSVHVD